MSFSSRSIKTAISAALILTMSVVAFADTIRLKDGSILKGRIVSFAGGKFTIAIGEGSRMKQMTYSASEIDSIQFDAPDKMPMTTPSSSNSGKPTMVNTSTASTPKVVTTDNVRIGANAGNTTTPVTKPIGGTMKPIVWNVKVLADNTANGWTNSGWVLKKGQKIRVSGDGKISLGKGKSSTASGISELDDAQKLLKNVPTGALIAVIGDDNNDFIYIGAEREFVATRDGALFLGINEGFLDDNSGAFNVKVEIIPDGSN
ncbi:MAG TPA: LecA/PA-IL family lectin [Pyrinomonadaceae bacterium]|nr:hypothetical protein [Chloracidobacterium sp.]MBP9934601.1 hypothetical protein [Pyrinomonadaceae bacterium]MBK7802849.1 hypothetical protein [Chloracidobacterium sp.]MBK9438507.1 hypothetical protein [Chloracidobacterium sp.]MBK9769090.1 hypothetical protein [Chloracidobacterium sp.]